MANTWSSTLARLSQYDTATICNIIELFDVRPHDAGYMDGRIMAAFPEMAPMVGFAATATFRSSALPRSGDAYASLEKQVERFPELSGPAVVVFQDIDSPAVGATFGEVMCRTYRAFGAVGLVTSGAGRDLPEVRKLGFPCFTNGTICSHGYLAIPQIHVAIHVGGLAVYPDDLLHGDANGVTTIPQEIAAEVVDVADEFIATETVVMEAMSKPGVDVKLLRECRAEGKAMREKIQARVSRSSKR